MLPSSGPQETPPSKSKLRRLALRARYQRLHVIPPFDSANPYKIVTIGQTDYRVGPAGNIIRIHPKNRSNHHATSR